MPFADAKYPPCHAAQATEQEVQLLLQALEPFAYLLDNPMDYPDETGEWEIVTADLVDARVAYCRVAYGALRVGAALTRTLRGGADA